MDNEMGLLLPRLKAAIILKDKELIGDLCAEIRLLNFNEISEHLLLEHEQLIDSGNDVLYS